MSIRQTLLDFLSDPSPRAMVLKGTWGRGKTHLWKTVRKDFENNPKVSPSPYSYVSLFGIDDLVDLKAAIFVNGGKSGAALDAEATKKNWFSRRGRKDISSAEPLLKSDLPFMKSAEAIYRVVVNSSIKGFVICFDDIERRGRNLRLLDLLGFITQLCEEKGCRVLTIINDGSLDGVDAEVWRTHREKVFQNELTYAPRAEECIEIAMPGPQQGYVHAAAKLGLVKLGVTNIRTALRLKNLADRVERSVEVSKFSEATLKRAGYALALLAFCHFSAGDGAPRLDFAFAHTRFHFAFVDETKDTRTSEEREWSELLDSYPTDISADQDAPLVDLVVDGSVEPDRLQAYFDGADATAEERQALDDYRGIWDLWHYDLSNNREKLVREFEAKFPKAASQITPVNADGATRLLREIGESDLADKIARLWIESQLKNSPEILSPRNMNRFHEIEDPLLRRLAENEYAARPVKLDLRDALAIIAEKSSDDADALRALELISLDDLVTYVLEHPGTDMIAAVTATIRLPNGKRFEMARSKMRAALRRIASQSPFQNHRIREKFHQAFGDEDIGA